MGKPRVIVVALLLLALPALPAAADPIQIVSGTLVLNSFDFNRATFSLVGADGSTIDGRWPFGSAQASRVCPGCPAGTVVSPAATWQFGVPFLGGDPFASGTAVIDGTSYSVVFGGNLDFTGPSASIPPRQVDGLQPTLASLTLPFSFSGTLNGYDVLGFREAQLRFSEQLVGQGLATLDFMADAPTAGPARFTYLRTTYEFQAAPIPEPGTLVLLGSGMVGGMLARARTRRRGVTRARSRGRE